jgi:hypothetical protein
MRRRRRRKMKRKRKRVLTAGDARRGMDGITLCTTHALT